MSEDAFLRSRMRLSTLLQQQRFAEAERACRETLASDPDDADITHLLAYAQYCQDGGEPRALVTVERAISLAPDEANHHALRSRILVQLDRLDEALASADEAVRLDPDDPDGFVARGLVHFRREDWARAEQAAREAREIDPEDAEAAHLLSESLRLQGREGENRDVLQERLARDPLDPNAHVSLGWRALQAGERDEAESHFLEALRLRPDHEGARRGLLESFKARAPWYRAWLRLNLWFLRFSRRGRWTILIGLYLAYRFSRVLFTGALAPVAFLITALWLMLVLWSHLASGTANFAVFLDPRARHALLPAEQLEAVSVGGCLALGLLALLAGVFAGAGTLAWMGVLLAAASIPFAYTFTNRSLRGRRLFGGIAAVCLLAALNGLLRGAGVPAAPDGITTALGTTALIGVVATTWLANVPALRK